MTIVLLFINLLFLVILFKYVIGISEKDRYAFRNHLTDICKKEKIFLHYCNTVEDLNETCFTEDDKQRLLKNGLAAGTYIHLKNTTELENLSTKYPRIYLTKKPYNYSNINSFNQTLNIMVFAHELGHHFEIKEKNDKSERAADKYAVKLFTDFFPWYKIALNSVLLISYLKRN